MGVLTCFQGRAQTAHCYYGLGMDALGDRMPLQHERNHGLGMDAVGHGMLLEHKHHYGSGVDALVTICSWNTNGIMVLAWMLR